jgi:DNA-binding CsgD family transcriptional regulator
MNQCVSPIVADSRPGRLNPDSYTHFHGVCADCPDNPKPPRRSKGNSEAWSRLPPLADRAIDALARCRDLTNREYEVLVLCCMGQKNTAMAVTLGISVSAVRRHLRNLHLKTNTSDKAELILNLWHACRACEDTMASGGNSSSLRL